MDYLHTYGAMTAGTLMEELKKVPSDTKVFIRDGGQFCDIILAKEELRPRWEKNGYPEEEREKVLTYTNDYIRFYDDGPEEDCVVILPRQSHY